MLQDTDHLSTNLSHTWTCWSVGSKYPYRASWLSSWETYFAEISAEFQTQHFGGYLEFMPDIQERSRGPEGARKAAWAALMAVRCIEHIEDSMHVFEVLQRESDARRATPL